MAIFTLTQEQYEALAALARAAADTPDKLRSVDAFLKSIEKSNGITRYALWIQWQEMNQPLPPNTNFPSVWPPQQRFFLENLTRPISKDDVQRVVAANAAKPINVLVTQDPGATVGWIPLDLYFVT
jgi:hypothetical protein